MAQIKTIDITPAKIQMPVIEVSQFDIGRDVIIHMKDGADWYDLTGLTVKLQGTKPSGFGYSVTGTVDGHDVTFSTIYDMTSESGFILSEVSIIDGTDVIGSQNVMLHVEASPHPPEIVDGSPETILPEMRELVNRAEAAAEILLDCSAIATTLPTGASATASYSPETGTFAFGLPRGAKGETGETGAPGNGISSIAKTGTSGLVDTYTITYTNGTTTTFTVTNGQNGTGSVADVTQNGVSVLDGSTAKVTVPTYDAVTDNEPYLFRQSGSGLDIHNREHDTLVGGSVAWNQRINPAQFASSKTFNGVTITYNNNGSVTMSGTANATGTTIMVNSMPRIDGHKYLFCGAKGGVQWAGWGSATDSGNGLVVASPTTGNASPYLYVINGTTYNVTFYPQCFDLTQMFGSTIADAIYAMEQSTSGSGVAFFKKLFPNSYYPYNSGELMSVSGVSSHDMTGFNQWDEEWESGAISASTGNPSSNNQYTRSKNFCPILPNTAYYRGAVTVANLGMFWYDADKNYIGVNYYATPQVLTTPSNAHYFKLHYQGTTYNHDICINISGSRNGEYEPYDKHSYPLDADLTLRGIPKLDANNSLYYDGDTYESDGTVTRKYGVVDLGTLSWTADGGNVYHISLADAKNVNNANAMTDAPYTHIPQSATADDKIYKTVWGANGLYVYFRNDSTASVNDFITTVQGKHLVYELATPTTETAEPYTNPQIVDNSGTEEYVSTSIVPVGHQTAYPDLFSGDYNDLVNKPTIPTETSQLTNDSDFVIDASYVHTDNNFTTTLKDKLDGIASGAEVNVQADWNEQSSASDAYIANKPTIPTVPAWAQAPSKPTYTASEVGAATADHVHGYITNGGDITASATIANGDRLVINDESASKVLNSSITFGTATNTYLRNNGTWGAPKTSTTASLTVAGWSSSTQTVTVTGVTTTNDVIVSPAPASYDAYVSAGIRCTAQASNSLTFTCTSTPSEAITVNVLIIL